jgi:hypothetical protein
VLNKADNPANHVIGRTRVIRRNVVVKRNEVAERAIGPDDVHLGFGRGSSLRLPE